MPFEKPFDAFQSKAKKSFLCPTDERIVLYVPGMLTELDAVMGPLSLASSMSSMVAYARQAVHWLRLDSQKGK